MMSWKNAKNNLFKTMLLITICYAVCYVFNSVYSLLIAVGTIDNLSVLFLRKSEIGLMLRNPMVQMLCHPML